MRRHAAGFCLLIFAAALPAAAQDAPICPPQGDAASPEMQDLNEKKARIDAPSDSDVDDTITIESLLEPGDDRLRWQDGQAVSITAFVVAVQDGGMASSNCHSPDPLDHDTVLLLSPSANVSDPSHQMIAAITPGQRQVAAGNRVDWSTRAIRGQYSQQTIVITGWLLFNSEAAASALNTAELAGINIARATAWEVHPVTAIALAPAGDGF